MGGQRRGSGDVVTSRGLQAASGSWERRGTRSPSQSAETRDAAGTLILDFPLPKLQENTFLLW